MANMDGEDEEFRPFPNEEEFLAFLNADAKTRVQLTPDNIFRKALLHNKSKTRNSPVPAFKTFTDCLVHMMRSDRYAVSAEFVMVNGRTLNKAKVEAMWKHHLFPNEELDDADIANIFFDGARGKRVRYARGDENPFHQAEDFDPPAAGARSSRAGEEERAEENAGAEAGV